MKIKLFTIPNLLTLSSLLCGSFAVVSALVYGDLALAFWLTIAAGVFDYSDGFVARLLKCPSAIGVQLDLVVRHGLVRLRPRRPCFSSCGTIPCLRMPRHGCATAAAPSVSSWRRFSALRLAKFNIDETQHTEFCGLPTPANALFFVALGWMDAKTGFNQGGWVLLMVPAMSWLLISPVRMFAFKFQSFAFKGNEIRYIFIALAVVLLVALGIPAVPIVILLYIAISAVGWGMSLKSLAQRLALRNSCIFKIF